MDIKDIYNTVAKNLDYKNMSNINPLKPLAIWANTNSMLDDFYKLPNINLGKTKADNDIRNVMRHMVGLGIAGREYNPTYAHVLGIGKEVGDVFTHRDVLENLIDSKKDFINNTLGINYMRDNPQKTEQDLIRYAYEVAKNGYQIPNNNGDLEILKNKPVTLKGKIEYNVFNKGE